MDYNSGFHTIETFIVTDQSGGRYFFDSEDAAATWGRVLAGRLKACYHVALEVKAYEEVSVALDLEPDWEEVDEQVKSDLLDSVEGDVPGGDEPIGEDDAQHHGGDKRDINRNMPRSNQRTYATRSPIKVIRR
jgi:hypothetical protein